jgi:uroporphyrinogen-III synthase
LSIVKQIDTHSTNTIKRYPLVVLSERIKTFAQSIGFTQVEVATKISDEGLLEALTNFTRIRQPQTVYCYIAFMRLQFAIVDLILRYPLVVLSERIKTFAQSMGFTQVKVATKISDEGLLEALTNLTSCGNNTLVTL